MAKTICDAASPAPGTAPMLVSTEQGVTMGLAVHTSGGEPIAALIAQVDQAADIELTGTSLIACAYAVAAAIDRELHELEANSSRWDSGLEAARNDAHIGKRSSIDACHTTESDNAGIICLAH
ncbi:MAG TPA: hypothetical protein VGM78_14715 [Ilumatobacteraceae bacterium]